MTATMSRNVPITPGAADLSPFIVEVRSVTKVYDTGRVKVPALRGVDLSLRRGEMVAVMGPSGCGKTTLLNCLSSLDEFDGGEVFVGGESISAMPDRKL